MCFGLQPAAVGAQSSTVGLCGLNYTALSQCGLRSVGVVDSCTSSCWSSAVGPVGGRGRLPLTCLMLWPPLQPWHDELHVHVCGLMEASVANWDLIYGWKPVGSSPTSYRCFPVPCPSSPSCEMADPGHACEWARPFGCVLVHYRWQCSCHECLAQLREFA